MMYHWTKSGSIRIFWSSEDIVLKKSQFLFYEPCATDPKDSNQIFLLHGALDYDDVPQYQVWLQKVRWIIIITTSIQYCSLVLSLCIMDYDDVPQYQVWLQKVRWIIIITTSIQYCSLVLSLCIMDYDDILSN